MSNSDKKGWARVRFGDVVQLSGKRSSNPNRDGLDRFVGLDHIDPGDLKIRRWGDIADGTTFTSVFRPGQVLFGKRRAYQRKVAVAEFSGVCSGDIYVLEPKNEHLVAELLPFICQTDSFFEHAVGTSAGSLSPRTNWDSLAAYEFALPPPVEQQRIAGALQLVEDLGGTFDATNHAIEQVVRSLSSEQFQGPAGNERLLADHYSIVTGQVDPRRPEFARLPLIAPNHIESRTGRLLALASAEEQSAISGKYLFDEGAVLYSKIRPNLIKATVAPCRGLCSADVYALMPKSTLHREYLLGVLLSDQFTQFAVAGSMRTGIPKVNREYLTQYRCRIPSLNEQDRYLGMVRDLHTARESVSLRETAVTEAKRQMLEGIDHAL